jgi:acylphosphatase
MEPSETLIRMVRYYLVKGRVQGVGFRWFIHQEAAALGLHGWVRNTEQGHVEIMAAGEEEDLAELRRIIDKGSRGSRVDKVDERNLVESEGEDLGPFKIEGAW